MSRAKRIALSRTHGLAWAAVLAFVLIWTASALGQPPSLIARWTVPIDASPIASRPVVANHTVYVGSWDGYEYAYGESSGRLRWRTFLGTTSGDCDGTHVIQGVTSAPSFWKDVGYVGGGGSHWYAFNPRTGSVLWRLWIGDNSQAGGNYNWSSPLVYRGFAYIGVSSLCDQPLVQGKLLRVRLSSHRINRVWKAAPDGRTGAGIWSNPVADPATNTVYVTTGNGGGRSGSSVVALNATTLHVRDHWSLPARSRVIDPDWGTSPTLFSDAQGRALLAAVNKNGVVYAFRRNRLHAGAVWRRPIAEGGPCPTCGDGSVSTGAFDGHRLYFAGGRTTIAGRAFGGAVRALNPRTGQVVWARGLASTVLGALATDNGMVFAAASDGSLYALNGSSGAVLYENHIGGGSRDVAIFGPPTVRDGTLFIGTTDGVLHALRLP